MRYSLTAGLTLILTVLATTCHMTHTITNARSQTEVNPTAKQLWEEAIAAKGGRERLQNVSNLVVSSVSKYHRPQKGINGDHTESFYVLPDKWWWWIDSRPGSFGLSISTFDFGHPAAWEIDSYLTKAVKITTKRDVPRADDPYQIYDPSAGVKFENMRKWFSERQVLYLMETKWIRPTPVNLRTASVRGSKFTVVETRVDDLRIDFYLDKKTNLPVIVVFTTKLESGDDWVERVDLSDYKEVGGIQMPQVVAWGRDEENRTAYQFNVDYDPSLFERAPTIDMGADAWRRR